MGNRHIEKDAEYVSIVKELHADLQRTEREREIESAFDDSMPAILSRLDTECDGNRSAMCRRINEQLKEQSKDDEEVSELSRGTLYNYLDKYDI